MLFCAHDNIYLNKNKKIDEMYVRPHRYFNEQKLWAMNFKGIRLVKRKLKNSISS